MFIVYTLTLFKSYIIRVILKPCSLGWSQINGAVLQGTSPWWVRSSGAAFWQLGRGGFSRWLPAFSPCGRDGQPDFWRSHDVDVSKNSGTPKSSIFRRFSIINHPILGYPHFRKHPCITKEIKEIFKIFVLSTVLTLLHVLLPAGLRVG